MVDTRFHDFAGPRLLGDLLVAIGAPQLQSALPPGFQVLGADDLDRAGASEIALAAHADYRAPLRETQAGLVFVTPALAAHVPTGSLSLVSDEAHALFVAALELLYPGGQRAAALRDRQRGAAPVLEVDVVLGNNVVLGDDVEIGRNSIIGSNSVIGRGVTIGRNAVIGANVTISHAHLGNGVVIKPGARIGSEGFGWLGAGRSNRRIPQLGRVIVQDNVEIGANTTVDRGALGDTVLGEGSKIDNLVQIAHNCRIGRFSVLAGTSALAGGTVIGDNVLLGGGVGTIGHLRIGNGSILSARSLVTKDVPAGAHWGGMPARDQKQYQRQQAALGRLSERDKE